MSMISSLIDELNKSADEWNGSNMFELARMCRDAADTICELRDDLQRANEAVRDAEHDESRAWDRVRKAEAEADRLRELAAGIGHLLFALDVDYCAGCPRDDINHPCPVYTVKGGECLYKTDLRDLGVEVDA